MSNQQSNGPVIHYVGLLLLPILMAMWIGVVSLSSPNLSIPALAMVTIFVAGVLYWERYIQRLLPAGRYELMHQKRLLGKFASLATLLAAIGGRPGCWLGGVIANAVGSVSALGGSRVAGFVSGGVIALFLTKRIVYK